MKLHLAYLPLVRFSDFLSGKPFYIVAYMISEIPKSRFWGRGHVLVVHEATPCFLFCFFWELYEPAGSYSLSSAVSLIDVKYINFGRAYLTFNFSLSSGTP